MIRRAGRFGKLHVLAERGCEKVFAKSFKNRDHSSASCRSIGATDALGIATNKQKWYSGHIPRIHRPREEKCHPCLVAALSLARSTMPPRSDPRVSRDGLSNPSTLSLFTLATMPNARRNTLPRPFQMAHSRSFRATEIP